MGDFYTLNFSDNQGLSLDVQGGELATIIKTVLENNLQATKVLLIGHSTGGLAAREYLQGLARVLDAETPILYREDVAKLITIGAPHQGSFWAEACNVQFDILNNAGICKLFNLNIDPNNIVVEELQPNSSALNNLNDLATHPLPSNIVYVSVVGIGQPILSSLTDFHDGDDIVSDSSQNLISVTESLPFQQQSIKVNIPFRECSNKIEIPRVGSVG
ncbi:hypothetical protein [Nitrosomonas communis]|uniref:PGAP1-like protein n=1 Tax=Nitrosomonas communis TaxID=44574 RepID=A0A1H2ZNX7_9PROT|nr:hypothetical protein [Nitrosomonas communis]SDX18971.1 PGAP1-like protein [Nitrosomonas communis]